MNLLRSIKFWISLAVFLAVSAVLFIAYTRYESTIRENVQLKADLGSLKTAFEDQKKSTKAALDSIEEWKKSQLTLARDLEQYHLTQVEAGKKLEKLDELFAKHDLANLAAKKPGLIARRANAATANYSRLFECTTAPGGSCADSLGEAWKNSTTSP